MLRLLTPLIRGRRSGNETASRPALEPIFTELARQWETNGRLVPGRQDEEWTVLTHHPWPGS